ncbi:serine threonine kinase [Fusarium globosum]|uniref:Serine threonine kinase n=1 Tax=Fusarium globosum TaxID=78864 RepID=A0A8H5YWE2_9HYPO|nr:serine threonine kinase [Fusarium globosum]
MDIFGTALAAGELILAFLSAYTAYNDEAESLRVNFSWDLRVIQDVQDHFEKVRLQNPDNRLSPRDQDLLETTTKYLGTLLIKVQKSLSKLHRSGFLHKHIAQATWIAKRSDLKELAEELRKWTQRFNIRLLGLPPDVGSIIPALNGQSTPPIITANRRLRQFVQLSFTEREDKAQGLLLEQPQAMIERLKGLPDISARPFNEGGHQIVFASRGVPPNEGPGTTAFADRQRDMGHFAAALNCLDDAANIRLLKVESYFYHPGIMHFLFAQTPPSQTTMMITLEDFIGLGSFPKVGVSLDQRFRLAYKLSEAVFFLHTAGFFHKNITSSSVVLFRRKASPEAQSSDLDNAYLMGFDLIRAADAKTTKEGAVKEPGSSPRSWEFDIFQHPDRLRGDGSPMYINTYDVYSLGVLLLEIGLWEKLSNAAERQVWNDPSTWAKQLSQLAMSSLGPRTGDRYKSLVKWCLSLDGNKLVSNAEFLQMILDPLESMANAISC